MKKYLIALVVVILLVIIAGVVYLNLNKPAVPDPIACTMEAKLCPDGVTYVGRQGPNCEFAPCPVVQVIDETADWKTYKNEEYSFKYPAIWKVSVSKYNDKNSLFGPEANDRSGLGGVEVFSNFSSIENFLAGSEAEYTEKVDIVVDNLLGIKASYVAAPARGGQQIALLKDGNIYNIFINSKNENDLMLFEQLISTFKFIK
jgi:hypothetical protein